MADGLDPQLVLAATRGVPKFPTIADVIQQIHDRQNASAAQAQELGLRAQQMKLGQLQIQEGQRTYDQNVSMDQLYRDMFAARGGAQPGNPAAAQQNPLPDGTLMNARTPGFVEASTPYQTPAQTPAAPPAMAAMPAPMPQSGGAGFDRDEFFRRAASLNLGSRFPELMQHFSAMDKAGADALDAQYKARTAKRDYEAKSLYPIYKANYDPAAAIGILQHNILTGEVDPQQGAEMIGKIQANPTPHFVRSIVEPNIQQSDAVMEMINKQTTADADKTRAGIDREKQDNEAGGQKADSAMKQKKLDAINNSNPQTRAAAVDAAIDPKKYPDENRRTKVLYEQAIQSGATPEEALSVVKSAAQGIEEFEKEKRLIPIRSDAEIRKAIALLPTEEAKQQAALRYSTGMRDANNVDTAYIKALGASEQLGRVLDLADQGSKAAGASLPVVTTQMLNEINGLKRYNSSEAAAVGGAAAGNLWDKTMGKLSGIAVGQPITQEIRDSIRELHQSIGESAYDTYTRGLDAASRRSGTTFAPTLDKPNIRKSAAGGGQYKVGDTVMYQGKPHKVTGINNGKLVLDGTQ